MAAEERAIRDRSPSRISSNPVIARIRCEVRQRAGGINSMSIRLDPAHDSLAPYLVGSLLAQILEQAPGRRIVLDLPEWQTGVLQAAQAVGFEERFRFHRMGLRLDTDEENQDPRGFPKTPGVLAGAVAGEEGQHPIL